MPRIPKEQVQPSDLYGMTKVDNNLSMRERIKKRFRPTDTVKVRNITNVDCKWQWFNEEDESYTIEDDTNIKITDRDEPGLWQLDAGETDVLIGACAYMMIEALYKQVCIMKIGIVINPLSENEVRNFSIDDPEKQEQFIDTVFLQKLSPSDMQQAAIAQLGEDSGKKILENLPALATEREEHERRQGAQRMMQRPRATDTKEEISQHQELNDLAEEFEPGSSLLGTATGGLPSDRQGAISPEPEAPAAPEKPAKAETEKPAKPAPAAPKPNPAKEKEPAVV